MNIVHNYNDQSVLFNEFEKQLPAARAFQKQVNKWLPNFVKTQIYLRPHIRSFEKFVFELPTEGFLLGLAIKSEIGTNGDNSDAEESIGSRLYSSIYLKQFDKVLAINSPEYIEARIDDSSNSEQQALREMVDTSKIWNNNVVTTYTPLFFSFTDVPDNALLLNFYRDLELEVNRNTDLDDTLDSPLTSLSFELVAFMGYMPDRYYNAYISDVLRSKKSPIYSGISILAYDNYVRSYSILEQSTTTTVHYDLRALIFAMHFILKDSLGSLQPIHDLTISVDNTDIVKTNKRLNYFDTGRQQNQISNHQGTHMFSYYFGLDKDRNYDSGAFNACSMRDLKINITYDTIEDDTHELVIVSEFYTMFNSDIMGRFDRKEIFN